MADASRDISVNRRLLNTALRSRVRRLVLWTFMNSLDPLSVSEICHKTRLYPSEVIGVIRGRPGSYEPQYSLLRLQLVTEITTKGHGDGRQKTYTFTCKDPTLLRYMENALKGYRQTGEA
jgi:predicted transcriptional regulator with HTH domain